MNNDFFVWLLPFTRRLWILSLGRIFQENLEWLISLRGFSQTVNNPNVLTAWYAGRYVPQIEALRDEDLMRGHKYILQKFLSTHYNTTTPDSMLR